MGITTYRETTNLRSLGSQLQLRNEPGGLRHYLDGKPVHCGDGLYVCIADQWIPTCYEARWLDGEPDPRIVLNFPALLGSCRLEIRPPADALFRWSHPEGER